MKILKKENGYTGVDASIAIIVIFIFVSIIANLIYASNSRAKEIEYKSKATEIAVNAIEEVKANIDKFSKKNIQLGTANSGKLCPIWVR